jgi:peptide-methionine (S)-S-oxide reductase
VTTYEEVCRGTSGHAEVVQVTFEPAAIAYRTLLEVFFTLHDPTTLNRQGADVGTQYRSAIFFHTPAQLATANSVIQELSGAGIWPNRIVTEVVPFQLFLPADPHHDAYFRRHAEQPYCRAVIAPKLAKLRARWTPLLIPAHEPPAGA